MKLQKTLLILSASAMLSAAVIAPDIALAQPFPGPPPARPSSWSRWRTPSRYARRRSCWSPWSGRSSGALAFLDFPAPGAPRVSLVPADLLVPGPLAFLVLPASEAVVRASLAATVALTAVPAPMPTAAPEPMAYGHTANYGYGRSGYGYGYGCGDTGYWPYGVYAYSNSSDSERLCLHLRVQLQPARRTGGLDLLRRVRRGGLLEDRMPSIQPS